MTRQKASNWVESISKYFRKTNNKNSNDEINKINKENISLSYFQLFRYATKLDRIIITIGIILASIGALGSPFYIIIYGELTSLLVDRSIKIGTSSSTIFLPYFGGGKILTNGTIEENRIALIDDSIAYCIANCTCAFLQFIFILIAIDLLNYSAFNQINRIHKLFFGSILRQDMTWYDMSSQNNNFATTMTEDLDKLKEGIGEKMIMFIFLIMTFNYSIIISFIYGWKLTLVVLSCTPIIVASTAFVAKIQSSLSEKELKSYSLAGNVAEEVFSGIRTVVAFSGEEKELKRYSDRLILAEKTGERKGFFTGLGSATMWFLVYCFYAIALWYGVKLILEEREKNTNEYTPGILVIVLFGVLMGAQNLGLTSPLLEAFATARGAALIIFSIIDRKSNIDSMDHLNGLKPNIVNGNIEFENIHFRYPARKDIEILKGINITVKCGQTVALVGSSGCGKSTCLQLFQRLYDPNYGCIKLDDNKINDLNVNWLRSQIALVGQEPVLFATTIRENILYDNPSACQKDIEDAAKIANCHNFIRNLPKGYDTLVGEKGSQMSGGQKQRIAIARAIIRNPKILLLDEATSALDPTSEHRVQDALDKASKGRTTLVVSHRLSAIINSDKIVYINNGVVAEEGSHYELMLKKGLYYNLVNATKKEEEAAIEDDNIELRNRRSNLKHQTSSISNNVEEQIFDDKEENIKEKYNVSMMQIMKLNLPEWKFILIGIFAAILNGSTLPLFAIIFGEFIGILALPDPNMITSASIIYSIYFIGLGVLAAIGSLLQFYMFNISGVRLTSRLRKQAFKTIISQEMGWFDEQRNSVGALCVRLSGDCANVQGATGSRIGSLVHAFGTLIIGIIISFFYSWSLTLVAMATIPFVLGSIIFESRYMAASNHNEKLAIESASQVAIEAIANIRTVTSLGQEIHVLDRYCNRINSVMLACRKKMRLRGTVFGLGQCLPCVAYAIAFYYGGILVANEGLEYKNIIKVSEALIFGTWTLGQALAYAPNVNAAIISAGRLLKLFERSKKINTPTYKTYNTIENTNGNINYKNVEFHYPTRPESLVLKGINLDIPKGSNIALVGPSGCGKSTCVQLLLRYYDPDSGNLTLSDTRTTDIPFHTLRSQIGLVSQEPVLFDRTIAENIAYGDNFHDISRNDIIDAAKKSNIHDFIINLPLGYDTPLGNKGAQLSGGQKQRIAIARALVRNPQILILDEATSALDVQSEKIVQEALDKARTGRTCITIAHRLSTIQNTDMICVLKNGVIIEKGNHDELMQLNGNYAELYRLQQVH